MKTYPFLAVFICLCVNTAAQEYSFKYGKITPDELRMTPLRTRTRCPGRLHLRRYGHPLLLRQFDPAAVLSYGQDQGIQGRRREVGRRGDRLRQLPAVERGRLPASTPQPTISWTAKTVKTQLKRQNIFEEVLDEHTKRLKFSIPEVRAGTVIEYRYLLRRTSSGRFRTSTSSTQYRSYAARRRSRSLNISPTISTRGGI